MNPQAPEQQEPQRAESPPGMMETIRTRSEIDPQTRQWQLSGFDIVEEIRHRLNGEIPRDDPSSEFPEWVKISRELANDRGKNELCWLLSSYINKNMQLSWYSPPQINILLIDFEKSLTWKLESDYRRMGIRKEDIDTVFQTIANTIWSAINRARFGGEKQFIEGTEERRIVSSESGDKKEKSFMDNIPVLGGLGK